MKKKPLIDDETMISVFALIIATAGCAFFLASIITSIILMVRWI